MRLVAAKMERKPREFFRFRFFTFTPMERQHEHFYAPEFFFCFGFFGRRAGAGYRRNPPNLSRPFVSL
jgi:hypothetical protein